MRVIRQTAVPGKPGMYVGVKISQTIEDNFSAYSLDYGTTWEMLDDSVQYTNVKMFNQNTGWAGGFNLDANTSGIYKWLGIPNLDSPYFTSLPITSINEGEEYSYEITAEDPNTLPLTITAQEKPDWLELTDNGDGTAILTGTAPTITQISQNFNVTLQASNGTDIGEQVFTITVHTTNTPPEFVSEPITSGVQYELYEYNIEATDADGDVITLTATTLPDWAEIIDNGDGTGKITGTPTEKSVIGFQVKIQASDGIHQVEQSFRVKVAESYVEDFGHGKINIFPNPTKNILNIQNCQNTNYEIIDVTGKVLQTGKINDSIETLDMSNFAKGNIFIKLQDNENCKNVNPTK